MPPPRLYLCDNAPTYTPATLKGAWDKTSHYFNYRLTTGGLGGGFAASVQNDENVTTTPYTVIGMRFISEPLAATTISGTLTLRIAVKNYGAAGTSDHALALHCYVTQGNSDSVRGTVLANYRDTAPNIFPATQTAKEWTIPVSTVAVSALDRLVLEVGVVSYNTHTTAFWSDLTSGFAGSGTPDVVMTLGGTGADGRAVLDVAAAPIPPDPPDRAPRVFHFDRDLFDFDVFGPIPPLYPDVPGGLVPLNPDAPWRDGPAISEITLMLPGETQPVTVSTSGVSAAWPVEQQGTFSCEVKTRDLIAAFGDADLRGRWLRWEHPTLGVWAGRINDVESDGESGTTELAARDYSDLLSSRRIAKVYEVNAAPSGALVKRVVRDAGRESGGYSWITAIVAEELGAPISLQLRDATVDDALRTIANRSGESYYVDEFRVLHWVRKRGVDLTGRVQLVEGRHVLGLRYALALGPIVNDLLAVPADDAYALSQAFVLDDDASIRRFGRRQDQISYTGMVTESTIRPLAQRDLARLVALGDTMRFDLVNVDGCFSWFREGDSLYLLAPSLNRRLRLRVLVRSYDSDAGVLSVSADVEGAA